MKSLIMILSVAISTLAFAGIEDFNQLIDDNKKEQQELHQKLTKETGVPTIDEIKSKKDLSEIRRKMLPTEAENIAVEGSALVDSGSAQPINERQLEKKSMKRLSKEFDIND